MQRSGKSVDMMRLHLFIFMICMTYRWVSPAGYNKVKSDPGSISLVIWGNTLFWSSGPRDEMEVDTEGCFSAPGDETSGRVRGWLFGLVWWTQQPNKLSPGSTGPCERFMCLNVKSCLQRWQGGAFSRVPCRFRQTLSARLTNRPMFFFLFFFLLH